MSSQITKVDPSFLDYFSKKNSKISARSIQAVLALAEEGATVPFIARYRKDQTGNLDEVEVRAVIEGFQSFNDMVKRKSFILTEIEKQGQLSEELKKRISLTDDLGELEEIYRPYKRKKKTKATLAKEAGLEPYAQWLWDLSHEGTKDSTTLEVKAKEFINPAKGYATYEEVLRGAQHILVERISNNPDLRKLVKEEYDKNGVVKVTKTTKFKPKSKYEMYGEFSDSVSKLATKKASHRYLALRRGWQEGELKVVIEADTEKLTDEFKKFACKDESVSSASFLKATAQAALTVHVIPSITNELHRQLKNTADEFAIEVFSENVRQVLMSSPFGARTVLGVDPGLKTGCKIALVDNKGQFISSTVLKTLGDKAEENAKKLFSEVTKQIQLDVVAVGNGTGGREAEKFIRKILKDIGQDKVPVILVNEAGASVYSASDIARTEFPDLDLTIRGAISIARRLQDPLAELVKIEPKSIGVGQYQHDVSQTKLKKSLHSVVESCVNQVGVDLNTASESLLQYVSGIGPALASNLVQHRKSKGLFSERSELLEVSRFSSKVFEQAAGFLRIPQSKTVLDRTGIHPESYSAVSEMAKESGVPISDLIGAGAKKILEKKEKWQKLVGEYTFNDIVSELMKPGRDPRDPFKVFQFRDDIHEVKDLKKDMVCPGIVSNVTNFGAFVDIGVHQDGLVHISELSNTFVSDPREVIKPGDQVQVKVLEVDGEKNQIALTMKLAEKTERAQGAAKSFRVRTGDGKKRPQGKKSAGQRKGKTQRGNGARKNNGNQNRRSQKTPFNNPFAALSGLKSK